ncbi:MAG: O-antigen ligase family protein [Chloroflexota bacterium]
MMQQSPAENQFRTWFTSLDRHIVAILVGLTLGIVGGLLGLLLVLTGPLVTLVVTVGIFSALYVLTDTTPALYGAMAITVLLPFGTFPYDIGITPTLLDLALAAFVGVYIVQWITGRRQKLTLVQPHIFIAVYVMWLIFAFMLGLRYGSPTTTILRQFAETLLSMSLAFVLVDLLSNEKTLRRLVLLVLALVGVQATIATGLYLLNDEVANQLLNVLSRIGYPGGFVIRYIEQTPDLGERAIGTWVDPNTLGGLLASSAVMIAPQLFARRPVLKYRWLTLLVFGVVVLALLLTNSRASFLAFGVGLGMIVFLRYRRYLPLVAMAGIIFLFLPQTQSYIDRIFQAFHGEDLATQMRIGEWTDSLTLISRYPLTGIGFTGTPTNDVYTDVANLYLIMANQIGLTGVLLFLLAMSSVFYYAWQARPYAENDPELDSIHLGYNLALLTALINGVADLYYFRLDFQSAITWFWLLVALALASSRLVLLRQHEQSTVEQSVQIR